MGKLFGTDGIRGVANQYPLTPEMAVRIGRSIAANFKADSQKARIVIGRDTRLSGHMLENALVSGVCSEGVDVLVSDIIPTPGVAMLAAELNAEAGVMISASHNPYTDNGIKVFDGNGRKLNDAVESEIEKRIMETSAEAHTFSEPGRVYRMTDGIAKYARFLKDRYRGGHNPSNHMRIVLDCANGATYQVAPMVFESLFTDVTVLFAEPDGKNINADCGSQHPRGLQQAVLEKGADIGLAFDGDGDRLIAVDDTGNIVTGDQILCICANALKQDGLLRNDLVVSTVMSNMGLKIALDALKIRHVTTQVGDRYVTQEMLKTGAAIGGEDSGHMIFLNQHTTGDGMLTALKLIEAIQNSGKPLSELKQIMSVYPQLLVNVDVARKPDIETIPALADAIRDVEQKLAGDGRVLVRYSGTEPLCRIMVEGPSEDVLQRYCQQLADVVRDAIGND